MEHTWCFPSVLQCHNNTVCCICINCNVTELWTKHMMYDQKQNSCFWSVVFYVNETHLYNLILREMCVWQPAHTEGTGEQILSTGLPGDQMDWFNPTVSFFWSHQNSLPLLFSLGFITVMVSILAILGFSLTKFRQWSAVQLAASTKLQNLHVSLRCSLFSTGYQS